MVWRLVLMAGVLAGVASSGCSRESLRVALTAQQRADQVQEAVFDRQHQALCVLLYRDLHARLERSGKPLTPAQRATVNDVWNERDLIEFWHVQHERAKALRQVGVDAALYGQQSVADLLYKSLAAKAERAKQGLADYAGQAIEHALTKEE